MLKITKKDAQQAHDLLNWCDRLSLILYRHGIPEMGRAVEINYGTDGTTYTLVQPVAGGHVVIRPWPFQTKEIEVSVEASVLTQLQSKDDAGLAVALRVAPNETLRCAQWRVERRAELIEAFISQYQLRQLEDTAMRMLRLQLE